MTSRRLKPSQLIRASLTLCVGLALVLSACAGTASFPEPTGTSAAAPRAANTASSVTATTHTLIVGGMRRSYLVVAPRNQHGPLPLLMVLHGRAVTPQQEESRTGFVPLAEQGQAVLVYPTGYGQSWNAGGCCGDAQSANIDDTTFISDVVTAMRHEYPIDGNRIYLVGYSNGARMAYTEVCERPTLFTAFATYAGVPTQSCGTNTPVPVLISAGTVDPELATSDPPQSAPQVINSLAQEWVTRNGCAKTTSTASIPPADVTTWPSCASGASVETVLYNGLTHYWPTGMDAGTPFSTVVGPRAAAATLMWNFLKTHVAPRSTSAN